MHATVTARRSGAKLSVLAVGLIAIAGGIPRAAAYGTLTGDFRVEAVCGSASGAVTIELDQGEWDPDTGTWHWEQSEPIPIFDGPTLVATLEGAVVTLTPADPVIRVTVSITAGLTDTFFRITSPVMYFEEPYQLCLGRADATITLADLQGLGGLAYMYGDPPGQGMCRPQYNGGSADFTSLIGLIEVDNGGVVQANGFDPAGNALRPFGETVDDLRTLLVFTLSAEDRVDIVTSYGPVREAALGDMNCDGTVNNGDVPPFVLALTNPAAYNAQYADCDRGLADVDGNGRVDAGDIPAFVYLLTHL